MFVCLKNIYLFDIILQIINIFQGILHNFFLKFPVVAREVPFRQRLNMREKNLVSNLHGLGKKFFDPLNIR